MIKYSNRQLLNKYGDLIDVLSYLQERAKKLKNQTRSDGAIIYVRVSTQDQVETNSLADQKRESLRRIKEMGVPFIPGAFFSDEGVSGRRLDRPNFKKAIDYAIINADKVSHFMVYCSDRFAREAILSALTRKFLKGLGITVCSVTDKMEEMNESQLRQKEDQNEEAGKAGIERTKRGMKTAREAGETTSNPPYGYTKGPPRQMPGSTDFERQTIEDPELFPYAQLIWKLALQGHRMHIIQQMAAAQGATMRYRKDKLIDKDTIHRILTNRFYAGRVRVEGEKWALGNHSAIVDEEEFDQVQRSLNFANSPQAVPHLSDRDEFPLRRFIRCENCGSGLTASCSSNRQKKKYGNYRCWRCGHVNVRADLLHERFIEELKRQVPPKAVLILLERAIRWVMKEQIASTGTMRERVQQDARKTRQDLVGIAQKMASGVIAEDAYKLLECELMKRLQNLESRSEQLANLDKITEKDVKKALQITQRSPALWPRLDLESMLALQSALFPSGITISSEGELKPIDTPLSMMCRLLAKTRTTSSSGENGTWNTGVHGLSPCSITSSSHAGDGKGCKAASGGTQSLGTPQVACESTTCGVSEGTEENLVPQARLERTTCGLGNRRSIQLSYWGTEG